MPLRAYADFRTFVMNGNKKDGFFNAVYECVKSVPKGKVASYGTIAAMAGNPRAARIVGWALHVNPEPEKIPCYRIVTKSGKVSSAFAFGGENVQRAMLVSDGVEFDENGNVKKEYFFHPYKQSNT